jgi:hypothetical protein
LFCSLLLAVEVAMDKERVRLQQDIARMRRDIRLQCREMQALIDADLDCSNVARLLMRMQADLMFCLEMRERLYALETA